MKATTKNGKSFEVKFSNYAMQADKEPCMHINYRNEWSKRSYDIINMNGTAQICIEGDIMEKMIQDYGLKGSFSNIRISLNVSVEEIKKQLQEKRKNIKIETLKKFTDNDIKNITIVNSSSQLYMNVDFEDEKKWTYIEREIIEANINEKYNVIGLLKKLHGRETMLNADADYFNFIGDELLDYDCDMGDYTITCIWKITLKGVEKIISELGAKADECESEKIAKLKREDEKRIILAAAGKLKIKEAFENELCVFGNEILSCSKHLLIHSLGAYERDGIIGVYTTGDAKLIPNSTTSYDIKGKLKDVGCMWDKEKKVWQIEAKESNWEKIITLLKKNDTKANPIKLGLSQCWECGRYSSRLDENGYCGC